jgi:hypothetical protein
LVAATRLHVTAVLLVEIDEVIRLQQHVAELRVAHPAARVVLTCAAESTLYGILSQHHVDGKVFAYVPQKLEITPGGCPIVVVQ